MMVKERIRKIFASKAFFIVFSILASVTIWLYVAYIENPDVPVTVKGIKIELLNNDYVTDRDLVITKVDTSTLTLRFNGRRNTVTKLSTVNVSATVDLSEIKTTGVYQLPYEVVYPIDINPSAIEISNRSVDYVTISVDTLSKKEIPVRGTYDGGVEEGYQAEPIELKPSIITISGPQEVIEKVSYAWVSVSRENISKTVEENLPFILMDENDREVTSDKLTYSQNTIGVTIPVVMIKEVPLTVTYITGAGADETNTVAVITPSKITISGDAETLSGLNQIVLGTIDLNKIMSSSTEIFQIVLPNNTANLTGTTQASVTVTISGLDSKNMRTMNIESINAAEGYTATIITKDLDIVLRGTAEELAKINPSNIRVVVDLSELGTTTGTYSVLAKVYVDGDYKTLGAIGQYKVTVKLTRG